jgi:hypothetical protein
VQGYVQARYCVQRHGHEVAKDGTQYCLQNGGRQQNRLLEGGRQMHQPLWFWIRVQGFGSVNTHQSTYLRTDSRLSNSQARVQHKAFIRTIAASEQSCKRPDPPPFRSTAIDWPSVPRRRCTLVCAHFLIITGSHNNTCAAPPPHTHTHIHYVCNVLSHG